MPDRKKKGSVLATVLMLTMFLAIITAVVANNTLQNFRATNWSSGAGSSRYIAYAGIQHAMIKLRDNPAYNDSFQGSVPGRDGFIYKVTVKNQRDKIPAPKTAPPGTGDSLPFDTSEIPENCAKIESHAIQTQNTAAGKVDRTISGMVGTAVFKPTSFKNAASARTTVLMSGESKTMAFDFWMYKDWARDNQDTSSSSGYINPNPGASSGTATPDKHTLVKGSADVSTMSMLNIGDTSKVEGDLYRPAPETATGVPAGRGTSPAAAAQAAADAALLAQLKDSDPALVAAMGTGPAADPVKGTNYTGTIKTPSTAGAKKVAAPPYDKSEATQVRSDFPGTSKKDDFGNTKWEPETLEPKAYKSIIVPRDQTLKLRPGRYYFADTFQVDGNIQIDGWNRGDVIIYVGRQMVVGGSGSVNFQGDPAQMQVYFTDEDHNKDPAGNDILTDGKGNKLAGFSHLRMSPGAKATVVAQGTNTVATLDEARLLGSVSANAVWMKNKATIEYDTNLADRQMAGASPWRLQGVYETVGR
eukprot:TRINITY_DN42457_c0_g1_i1.p1 TRINITY_DN42457_c0_g1~~TRINITY_DN42457_c0_g1_i1.p1  ORF type:complete len:529 (+),score=73.18 TRINITY_DN42457_c0_g1_i1:1176-2762(+)